VISCSPERCIKCGTASLQRQSTWSSLWSAAVLNVVLSVELPVYRDNQPGDPPHRLLLLVAYS